MKSTIRHLIKLLPILALSSCAYTIPNGGQAVINDVTDSIPLVTSNKSVSFQSSVTHAQARQQQANNFWGGN